MNLHHCRQVEIDLFRMFSVDSSHFHFLLNKVLGLIGLISLWNATSKKQSSTSTITKLQKHLNCLALHQNIAKQITKHFKYLPRGACLHVCTKYLSLRQGNPFSCKPMPGEMGHESEKTLGMHKL